MQFMHCTKYRVINVRLVCGELSTVSLKENCRSSVINTNSILRFFRLYFAWHFQTENIAHSVTPGLKAASVCTAKGRDKFL